MSKGFVYVLSNTALVGLVKVGFTTKIPEIRAAELTSTGIPAPFVVEYYCLCDDADALEGRVHEALAHARYNNDREFFSVSPQQAISAIESTAQSLEHAWRRVHASAAIGDASTQRPAFVVCPGCKAQYVSARYCPKCQVRLTW